MFLSVFFNEPGRLGTTPWELVPSCLVKWVPHWNTLTTTKTSQTGQATSSLQCPLDLSTSGWLLLIFLYIPDGASPSSSRTLGQTILRPMKQSSPALSISTVGIMPFLAILENVSGYSLRCGFFYFYKLNQNLHANDSKKQAHVADYASIFYHRKYRCLRNTTPEHNLFIYFGHITIVWAPIKISFNLSRLPHNRKTISTHLRKSA